MNNSEVQKVKAFASKAHDSVGQKYGDKPYSYHLAMVADYTAQYVHLVSVENQTLAMKGAWVHDLLEDLGFSYSYNDVSNLLGADVAEISFLLQTPKGRNRSERHCDAYYQELATSLVAVLVKIADRMANLKASIESFLTKPKRGSLLYRYVSERGHFEKHMRSAWPQLEPAWEELDKTYSEARHEIIMWELSNPINEKALV